MDHWVDILSCFSFGHLICSPTARWRRVYFNVFYSKCTWLHLCWEGCWLCSRWRVLSLEEVPMRFMIRNFHNRWRLNPFHFSLNCQWICCPQRLHGFHKTDQLTCLCWIILPWCVQPKVRLLWKLRLGRVSAWSCISCPGMRTLGLIRMVRWTIRLLLAQWEVTWAWTSTSGHLTLGCSFTLWCRVQTWHLSSVVNLLFLKIWKCSVYLRYLAFVSEIFLAVNVMKEMCPLVHPESVKQGRI